MTRKTLLGLAMILVATTILTMVSTTEVLARGIAWAI